MAASQLHPRHRDRPVAMLVTVLAVVLTATMVSGVRIGGAADRPLMAIAEDDDTSPAHVAQALVAPLSLGVFMDGCFGKRSCLIQDRDASVYDGVATLDTILARCDEDAIYVGDGVELATYKDHVRHSQSHRNGRVRASAKLIREALQARRTGREWE